MDQIPGHITWFARQARSLFLRRFVLALLVPVFLTVIGTAGYCLIEGWSVSDALYMTVITLTTVGYREVADLSPAGRVFTMFLCMGGVFTLFYASASVIRAIVSGEVRTVLGREIMEHNLAELKDHVIVCGFGRVGRMVCKEFSLQHTPFVVIDRKEDKLDNFHIAHGIPLPGDASSDDTLKQAGIERARALVTVMSSDAENLFAVMSARMLNDRLFIVSRAEDERAEQKLVRGGANRVILPHAIGGFQVAQAVLRPTVVDFIELATKTEYLELQIEEVRLAEPSALVGRSLGDSQVGRELGIIIVAIKKQDGDMVYNPPAETVLEAGDILIALGHPEQLKQLVARAGG